MSGKEMNEEDHMGMGMGKGKIPYRPLAPRPSRPYSRTAPSLLRPLRYSFLRDVIKDGREAREKVLGKLPQVNEDTVMKKEEEKEKEKLELEEELHEDDDNFIETEIAMEEQIGKDADFEEEVSHVKSKAEIKENDAFKETEMDTEENGENGEKGKKDQQDKDEDEEEKLKSDEDNYADDALMLKKTKISMHEEEKKKEKEEIKRSSSSAFQQPPILNVIHDFR